MEKYRPQPNRKHNAPEGGQSSHGFQNRQAEQALPGGGSISPERQPLPNVWDVLERDVMIGERYHKEGLTSQEYEQGDREQSEVKMLANEIREKGTVDAKLILDLYNTVTLEPSALPVPIPYNRSLSREEYQQFRSKVEPLSEVQLAEEIVKAQEDSKRREREHPGRRWPDYPGINV